jgi:large subunit ribosomal protein L25
MAGEVPAVLYGLAKEPVLLAVNERRLEGLLQHGRGNLILELTVNGAAQTSIIRELQREPVSGRPVHVDFQRISLTESIQRAIPVHLTGTSVGVKDFGGILDFVRREVVVEGLPTQIPDSIEADVSQLMIGDSIFARDLSAPGIRILTEPDMVIAHVVPPAVYQEATPGEAPAEPEVVQKGGAAETPEAE